MSMGGGGGGSPSQTTQYSTNIPEYARPYVENMLGATQAQLFNTQQVGAKPATYDEMGNMISPATEGTTQISGFRPYQPYSTNVNDYFAGPSPMQQQSYQGMANMQVAPQLAQGSQLAGTAGIGSLGLGTQAAGAGANYAQMATDPNSVRAYMSPYMQNVVDYQKGQAIRDYAMAMPKLQAQAVGQGAFGGNRMALQQAEAGRGLMSQLQGIEAQGAQRAFDTAQQAQQFGANLGLQGLQTGLQGYGQALGAGTALGQLGQTQYGQQMGILQGQNQFGQQQQQLEQQKINQAISDYATAQQYPMLQLGLMSNMLRGLPMQSQTTQMYQAQPSYLQQGIGTLGALGSLYGAGKKEGGVVGYKYGGAIAEPKLAAMADKLDIAQLQQRLKDPQLDAGERQIFADALQDKAKDKARYAGIAAAGGGLFEGQGYAGGGILAFAGEEDSLVDLEKALKKKEDAEKPSLFKSLGQDFSKNLAAMAPAKKYSAEQLDEIARGQGVFPEGSKALPTETSAAPVTAKGTASESAPATASQAAAAPSSSSAAQTTTGKSLADLLAQRKTLGPQGEAGEDFMKFIEDRLGKSSERLGKADKLAMAKAFAEFGSTAAPGGIGQAISRGLGTYAGEYGKAVAAEDAITLEAQKMRKDLDVARRAEARGDVEGAQKAYDSAENRRVEIQKAQIQAAATMSGHGATQKAEAAAIERIMKEKGVGYTEALQLYKGAGKMESNDINAIKASIEVLQNSLLSPGMSKEDRAKVQQQIAGLNQQLIAIGSKGGAGGETTATNPDAGGIVNVPGKGRFQQLPNGNYIKIG